MKLSRGKLPAFFKIKNMIPQEVKTATYKLFFNSKLRYSCVNGTSESKVVVNEILKRFPCDKIRDAYITRKCGNQTEVIFKVGNDPFKKVWDKLEEVEYKSTRAAEIITGIRRATITSQCLNVRGFKTRFCYLDDKKNYL